MEEERKKLIIMYLVYRRQRRKKCRHRRFWVHPINLQRNVVGAFNTLYPCLLADGQKFFNYFRMTISTFKDLLQRMEPYIARQNTVMRDAIRPAEMLAVTLRYLASGCSLTDLHYSYRLGISTVSNIIQHVCCNFWDCLQEEFMPIPNEDQWKAIAEKFEYKANFPNCIGAVDGKHIRMIKPENSGSMFFNYKDYFSIVLLVIADSDYRFVFVDIGSYGKDCDSTIFKETSFWNLLQQNALKIPKASCPAGTNTPLPYVLVGDEAFALTSHLLRPFGGNHLSVKKKIFNYRLTRARRYVECAFGILSNKWRIFHRPLNVSHEFAISIVKAACILHNFVRQKDGYTFEDLLEVVGFEDVAQKGHGVRGGRLANEVRNQFADYFQSEAGSVPWQLSKI